MFQKRLNREKAPSNDEETQKIGWEFDDAIQRLLDMQSSPWNRYPWNMKLTGEEKRENGPKLEESTEPEEDTDLEEEIDLEDGSDLIAAAR